MSNLPLSEANTQVLSSVSINIPQQLHQEPVLSNLISNYDLIVNFHAAVLDRQATGGGWFKLSLQGTLQDIEQALDYLRNLEIEIFSHGVLPITVGSASPTATTEKKLSPQNIDRLVNGFDI
jgi:beta-phosphoglucomutase-like phosphatase (HAD superfamily)